MVITDRFVYVHMPKTGGTFVTSVLERLHAPRVARATGCRRVTRALRGPRPAAGPYGPLANVEPKHGTCADIPEAERSKPVLSSVRNPLDWYVSQYEFAWWKKTFLYHPEPHPTPVGYAIEETLPEFERTHPHFPDLSFEEFVDLCFRAARVYDAPAGTDLGLYTHGFLRYYFRAPDDAAARLSLSYLRSGAHRADMFDVHFLDTARLNAELHAFLTRAGYRADDLAFLPALGKILPEGRGRRSDQNWERYYTPALAEAVRRREWALFASFPQFAW